MTDLAGNRIGGREDPGEEKWKIGLILGVLFVIIGGEERRGES